MSNDDGFTVSEKVKQSLHCELDVSYGPGIRQKYDIFTGNSTPQGARNISAVYYQHSR